jgi:hypothetical protein
MRFEGMRMPTLQEQLRTALEDLIAAHRVALDGREVHIEFYEDALSQACLAIAKQQLENKGHV